MAMTTLAVDVTGYGVEEPLTMWLGLIAFGAIAERLSRVRKGDTVSVHGRLTQKPYETAAGEKRPGFSLLVESLICNRPKVGKKREQRQNMGGDLDYNNEHHRTA